MTNFPGIIYQATNFFMKLIFLVAIFLQSCSQPEAGKLEKSPQASRLSVVDSLFKDLIIEDTFYVYSSWGGPDNHPFKGVPMDSMQVALLTYDLKMSYSYFKDVGACYKFPLDASRFALITRVPGEYESTAIKLFVFDVEKDSVVQTLSLADVFGDAGESMSYSSCIFREKNHGLKVATQWQSEYSHNVDNENDTTVERWNRFWVLDLGKHTGDTLLKDSATIADTYPQIIQRLSHY